MWNSRILHMSCQALQDSPASWGNPGTTGSRANDRARKDAGCLGTQLLGLRVFPAARISPRKASVWKTPIRPRLVVLNPSVAFRYLPHGKTRTWPSLHGRCQPSICSADGLFIRAEGPPRGCCSAVVQVVRLCAPLHMRLLLFCAMGAPPWCSDPTGPQITNAPVDPWWEHERLSSNVFIITLSKALLHPVWLAVICASSPASSAFWGTAVFYLSSRGSY